MAPQIKGRGSLSLSDHFSRQQDLSRPEKNASSYSNLDDQSMTDVTEDSFSLASRSSIRSARTSCSFRPLWQGDVEHGVCLSDIDSDDDDEEGMEAMDLGDDEDSQLDDDDMAVAIRAARLAQQMARESLKPPQVRPHQPRFVRERMETFSRNVEAIASQARQDHEEFQNGETSVVHLLQQRVSVFSRNMITLSRLLVNGGE